eukprot:g14605.t1
MKASAGAPAPTTRYEQLVPSQFCGGGDNGKDQEGADQFAQHSGKSPAVKSSASAILENESPELCECARAVLEVEKNFRRF